MSLNEWIAAQPGCNRLKFYDLQPGRYWPYSGWPNVPTISFKSIYTATKVFIEAIGYDIKNAIALPQLCISIGKSTIFYGNIACDIITVHGLLCQDIFILFSRHVIIGLFLCKFVDRLGRPQSDNLVVESVTKSTARRNTQRTKAKNAFWPIHNDNICYVVGTDHCYKYIWANMFVHAIFIHQVYCNLHICIFWLDDVCLIWRIENFVDLMYQIHNLLLYMYSTT